MSKFEDDRLLEENKLPKEDSLCKEDSLFADDESVADDTLLDEIKKFNNLMEMELMNRKYKNIQPPKELNEVVNKAIQQSRHGMKIQEDKEDKETKEGKSVKEMITLKEYRAAKYRSYIKGGGIVVAACFVLFFIGLNTSEVFAQQVSKIPIVGDIAKIFTVREYEKEDDTKKVEVEIPAISGTDNKELEQRINEEIEAKVNEHVKESEKRIEEYKTAFLETGGLEEDFIKPKVSVDYKITASNEKTLSFVITAVEDWSNAYGEQYFYNIDLEKQKEIELKDILGEDYIQIANDSIKMQIKDREAKNPEEMFFEEDMGGFTSIAEDQSFFINEKGNPVIVFAKYTIAPGAMGSQKFEILKGK